MSLTQVTSHLHRSVSSAFADLPKHTLVCQAASSFGAGRFFLRLPNFDNLDASFSSFSAVSTDATVRMRSFESPCQDSIGILFLLGRGCPRLGGRVAYPDSVYQATRRNAEVGELAESGTGVSQAIMGFPFPIQNNAIEIIWNHTLRFRSFKATRQFTAAAVTRSGEYTLQTVQDEAILQWSDPTKGSAEELDNISIYYIANTVAPARAAGSVILVHETLTGRRTLLMTIQAQTLMV